MTQAPRLTEVADGVHVYEQAPGGWCLSNAGVLAGVDHSVVIDTTATESRSRRLLEAVKGLAAGAVRTLVNTHHHGDHTFGNSAFGPEVTIVAHELARTEMAETGPALTDLWPDVDWGKVSITLPSLTFTERLTLHIGDRRVELIHAGPAHTTNDVVAWLPVERVLFTGDVVLSGATPFVLMGSVAGTLVAVRRLRALQPRILVTGHGPVCGPEAFDVTEAYLLRVQRLAAEGAALGLTPLQVARLHGAGEFADLIDPERLVGSLHRAYAELEPVAGLAAVDWGRPLNVAGVFGEMIEYNGGRLPTCLA